MLKYLVAAFVAVSAGVAGAADLPRKAPVVQQVVTESTWAGFYIGLHGGYGWSEFSPAIDIAPFENPSGKGWLFGGHAGYLWQFGMFAGGLEIDYSATEIESSQSITVAPIVEVPAIAGIVLPAGTTTLRTKVSALASARARAGFIMANNFFLYGTGGLAWAKTEGDVLYAPVEGAALLATTSGNNFGWVAGIGGEFKLMNNLLLRAEFLHYDFGATNYTFTGVGVPTASVESDLTVQVVRGGLSFRF